MTEDKIVQIWLAAEELAGGDSAEAAQMLMRAAAFASVEAKADPAAIKSEYDQALEVAGDALGSAGVLQ